MNLVSEVRMNVSIMHVISFKKIPLRGQNPAKGPQTLQRVLRHAISTSKAYYDIAFVALHINKNLYIDLHTYLPVHISSYIHFYQ